jgi:V/A-type H+-transporting ATPase subunit A
VDFHHLADNVVSKGLPISKITSLPVAEEIMRIKTGIPNDKLSLLDDLAKKMRESFEILETNMR